MSFRPIASLTESEKTHEEKARKFNFKDPLQPQTASSDKAEVVKTDGTLQNLKLASQQVLDRAQKGGRSKCPKCSSSRMFYCYTCFVLVESLPQNEVPKVKLPLKVDIIKHPHETDGKSTAVHAKLLAPDDVSVYTYPCIPEYEDERHEIVLVFPGPKSVSVQDIPTKLLKLDTKNSVHTQGSDISTEGIPAKCMKKDLTLEDVQADETEAQDENKTKTLLKKVVFIDSTWNQTNKIITDERLQGLVQVELTARKTCFWRRQKGKPDTYLATIEAIYYFLTDYHKRVLKESYQGEYDNLLFFYSFMHRLINNAKYTAGKL
ncbi:tRNA-uridine aminocarboxypropyltransferase 1 [Latimeria chalumnae]|uniref:tRNA-uridine aminocarboxypropyltransferase 1 n=1 Tax=Latimeria chalumnae TaxID=7897 RepID=H3B414_LATCH|nr:PREDICTED: DTW domain-containing protein 1 [Latimeria chalumnae]XP_005998378.1 PREDICTED: DTW domain-containing protein 1 [Latimeria chalumnae]XP_005998379.1 PREDICTED: DTW domain-containing protein 1 [Latimeria chalumnae]XP_005998380.1 PREDICTED: DTW domain-containing protein 1 [Latimeria chalumnae]XP_005998381.1 PREDICTED: DTW domain-containing protein 1 [Latimeria chalumnae]|eukprot:XP_005998377.1 PREDICTED: DTW domain-containing protein 1 [Latimeria chalumnae]